MGNVVLPHKGFKNFVTKIFSPITKDSTRGAKRSEDKLLKKFDHNFVIIDFTCYSLNPFRYMVNSNEYVLVPNGGRCGRLGKDRSGGVLRIW